jgi:hypothetical protein
MRIAFSGDSGPAVGRRSSVGQGILPCLETLGFLPRLM